jgi:basic membrane lipoprotein Med (substrate-binding protein (PBP1-ABC) superfamily)
MVKKFKTFKERQKEFAIKMYEKMTEEEKKEYNQARNLKHKDKKTESNREYNKKPESKEKSRISSKKHYLQNKEELDMKHTERRQTEEFKMYKKEYNRKYREAKKLIDTDK